MTEKKVGFVIAMEKEARLLLELATIEKEKTLSGKKVYEGNIWKTSFVLIIAGIGKVNSAMSTQILIDKYKLSKVINFGLAGGKSGSGLKAGQIVEVEKCCQYDFDLSELDDVSIGYMQDYDLVYYPLAVNNIFKSVSCATGDRFTSKQMFLKIISDLGAQIADMECGAIAQVCYANDIPLHAIKLISDVDCNKTSIFEQYNNNVKSVCGKLPKAIKKVLSK